jgi:hypothetical protein
MKILSLGSVYEIAWVNFRNSWKNFAVLYKILGLSLPRSGWSLTGVADMKRKYHKPLKIIFHQGISLNDYPRSANLLMTQIYI